MLGLRKLSLVALVAFGFSASFAQAQNCACPSCAAPACTPSCAAPACAPHTCQPTCDVLGCHSQPTCHTCRPGKTVNVCININKGDKSKVKRNVVLGAMGEFAGGSAPPTESIVLPTAAVLNVSTLGIPVMFNATEAGRRQEAQPESNDDDVNLKQLSRDVQELKNIVGQLAARDAARSAIEADKLKDELK